MENKIVSFDTETTSLSRKTTKIVQLSIYNPLKDEYGNIKIAPLVNDEFRKNLLESEVWVGEDNKQYRLIEKEAEEVHKISNQMLVDKKPFDYYAKKLVDNLVKSDYVLTMNGHFFDRPIFENELRLISEKLYEESLKIKWIDIYRLHLHYNPMPKSLNDLCAIYSGEDNGWENNDKYANIMILLKLIFDKANLKLDNDNILKSIGDVLGYDKLMKIEDIPLKLHFKLFGNTLSHLHKFYLGTEMVNAHDAEADSRANYDIYLAMKDKYKIDDEESFKITNNFKASDFINLGKIKNKGTLEEENIVLTFGKFKDKPLEILFNNSEGLKYYSWIQKGDFDRFFKQWLAEEKEKFLG